METLNNDHKYTVIATINKIYNIARINGLLNSKELYLLDLIYNMLCNNIEICTRDYNKLIQLYFSILNSSKLLCKSNNIREYYYNTNNDFHIGIINTPPTIEDPVIIEPDPIEVISGCDGTAGLFSYFDYLTMEYGSFTKCYEPTTLVFESIKILSLPTMGILQYNGVNLEINTTINFSNISNLTYTPIVERGLSLEDTFTYTMTTDEVIPRITEISTITILIR